MNNLRANAFQQLKTGTTSRVWTEVDGTELWFESDDIELYPSTEALATLWIIPALLSNRNLELNEQVCETWKTNAQAAMEFLKRFWGTTPVQIVAKAPGDEKATSSGKAATGLFFTCGVDSFYTLLKNPEPDYLIYIESFDVPDDQQRTKLARQRLETVASTIGAKPIVVRTNVKKHPTFSAHSLADTHAALLAAVGHLLTPHLVSVTISPSWSIDHNFVSGSHWQLDPLWSSAQIQVIHGDPHEARFDRVKAICDSDLAQKNLHVCFENRACSRCEKCVRTMLDLHVAGKLSKFKMFDQSKSIIEALDSLSSIRHTIFFEPALHKSDSPELVDAVKRLLWRSARATSALEQEAKKRREVDEQFPKVKEGLENALHHYSLLQEEHKKLAADYAAIVGNLPIKTGIRLVRKVAGKLRKPEVK